MITIAKTSEILEYREHPGLNQSFLKDMILPLNKINAKYKENKVEKITQGLIIGSAVDMYLLGDRKEFLETYHAVEELKMTDKEEEINEYIFSHQNDFETLDELLIEAFIATNYQPKWKMETKLEKWDKEKTQEYLDRKNDTTGIYLSHEDYNRVIKIGDSLSQLFPEIFYDQGDDVHTYFQEPIYFDNCYGFEGSYKALLDIMIVKETEDTINIDIIDLKTTSYETVEFYNSAMKFRYDIQIAFYRAAVKWLYRDSKKELNIKCFFAVESTTTIGTPVLIEADDTFIQQGISGREEVNIQDIEGNIVTILKKEIVGIVQLIYIYNFYKEDGWKTDILFYNKLIEQINNNRLVITHNKLISL